MFKTEGLKAKLWQFAMRYELFIIFILLFAVYLSNCFYYMSATDNIPAILLPFSILDQHNVYLDQFAGYYQGTTNWWGSYFFTEARGHFLSSYPIVTPLLVTPLYVIPYAAIKLIGIPVDLHDGRFFLLAYAMEKLSAGFVAALSGVIFYRLLRELFSQKMALLGVLIFALATSTWTIASQGLWQHGISELLLCLILYLIVRDIKSHRDINYVFLGILSALLVFNRPTSALLVLPVIFYVLYGGLKGLLTYVIPAAAVALPFLAYNLYFFQGVFGGYGGLTSMFGFAPADVAYRLAGLLASPSRGLLVYTPVAVLAVFGALYVAQVKEPRARAMLYAFGLATIAFVLTFACYEFWWGGGCYGPRFFTDIIPIIVLFAMLCIGHVLGMKRGNYRTVLIGLIGLLIILSLLVQAIGAYYYPVYGFQWGHGQSITFTDQSKLWDWKDTQISESVDWLFNSSNHGYHYSISGGNVSVSKT